MSATTIADTIKTGHFSKRRKDSEMVVLAHSASPVNAPANDTNENALATVTIPAGALGPNGFLRVTTSWAYTGSTNSKSLRIRLGGVGGTAHLATARTSGTELAYVDQRIIANRNAQNSQFSNPSGTQVGASTAAGVTGSIDTSAETTLVITGQKATGSETLTLASYLVELHYRA
jgi:hypothetical protein